MKFSIKDFSSKCDQIRSFLRIWSHLLMKSFMENFIIFMQWYLELVTSTEAMEVKYSFISSLLSISLSTPYKTSSGNWKSNVNDAKKKLGMKWGRDSIWLPEPLLTLWIHQWLPNGYFNICFRVNSRVKLAIERYIAQPAFTCSILIIKTIEKGVKYVQWQQ